MYKHKKMGNICTNTKTKNTQTETTETRSFGIQTDDHKIIFLSVVSPTEFMKSIISPTSNTDSSEKIFKRDWPGEIQLEFAPCAKNYQEPKHENSSIKFFEPRRENPTINYFEDFDFDPNYITG